MKNLVPFLFALGMGFALGKRRARKRGSIELMTVEIQVDSSQAVSALAAVDKKAQQATVHLNQCIASAERLERILDGPVQVEVVGTLKASGADLQAALRTHSYRNLRPNEGFPTPPARPLDEVLAPSYRSLRTS